MKAGIASLAFRNVNARAALASSWSAVFAEALVFLAFVKSVRRPVLVSILQRNFMKNVLKLTASHIREPIRGSHFPTGVQLVLETVT